MAFALDQRVDKPLVGLGHLRQQQRSVEERDAAERFTLGATPGHLLPQQVKHPLVLPVKRLDKHVGDGPRRRLTLELPTLAVLEELRRHYLTLHRRSLSLVIEQSEELTRRLDPGGKLGVALLQYRCLERAEDLVRLSAEIFRDVLVEHGHGHLVVLGRHIGQGFQHVVEKLYLLADVVFADLAYYLEQLGLVVLPAQQELAPRHRLLQRIRTARHEV